MHNLKMGNGCGTCNVFVEESSIKTRVIKIKKKTSNINKLLVDMRLIKKFLNKINLQKSKELKIGPYFLLEFEEENKQFYMNFLKNIKYLNFNHLKSSIENSDNSKNSKSESDLKWDLNYFYSLENIKEIELQYFSQEEKFQEFLNLFKKYPIQEIRIFMYFVIFSGRNELYKLNKSLNSSNDLLLINKNLSGSKDYDEAIERIINCDLPRTFPRAKIMKQDNFSEIMKETLLDISIIDKELGYVQGINNIVGYLLMLTGNCKEVCITIFFSIMNMRSYLTNKKFRGIISFKIL